MEGVEALSDISGKSWYITATDITIEGQAIFGLRFGNLAMPSAGQNYKVDLVTQSANIARATVTLGNGSANFMLYSSRTKKSNFSGSVVRSTGSSDSVYRAVGGLGGIQVAVTNLKNAADKATVTTDAKGDYTVPESIAGDSFSVTAQGTTATVNPSVDKSEVGIITVVTAEPSIKASVTPRGTTDMMLLYAVRAVYELTFEFENVGSSPAQSLTVTIASDPDLTITGFSGTSTSLGSISSGAKKTINGTVSCAAITEDYAFKTISFTTKDNMGNTWEDKATLRFNRTPVVFRIQNSTGGPLQGMIISPAGKTMPFKTTPTHVLYPDRYDYVAKIELPKWKDADYLVAFTGVSNDNGKDSAHYYLGVDVYSDSDPYPWSSTLPEANYDDDEPNDTEDTAKPFIVSDAGSPDFKLFTSYLRKGNMDYFKVRITD
jgi:hypothetical protein